MASLTGMYYYGVVVGTTVDPMCSGAVQAKILGITDDWKDDVQPWVYPQLGYGMQSVPQKGQYLLVIFVNGDINQGMYYGISQSAGFLPDEYKESYPDVAYANLGETGFTYVHNRGTHTTKIHNTGNGSTVTWDSTGSISVEEESSTSEYEQTTYPVLTEATIDIFTCSPIGSSDTIGRQGSEYLSVAQMSQSTVNAIRGGVSKPQSKRADSPAVPSEGQTRDIVGVDSDGKDHTYKVSYEESPAVSPRVGNRTPKCILVGGTGGSLYSRMLESFVSDGSTMCVHYLVGTGDGDPDVLSSVADVASATNHGFVQFAELKDDTRFGSDMLGSPNVGAITVMFYTTVTGSIGNKDYAEEKLKDIINHVKKAYGLDEIEVKAYTGNILDYAALEYMEGDY